MCPRDKARPYDARRGDYCGECPRRREAERLARDVAVTWEKWLGEDARRFEFGWVLDTLQGVQSMRRGTDRGSLSTKAATLIDAYDVEEARFKDK